MTTAGFGPLAASEPGRHSDSSAHQTRTIPGPPSDDDYTGACRRGIVRFFSRQPSSKWQPGPGPAADPEPPSRWHQLGPGPECVTVTGAAGAAALEIIDGGSRHDSPTGRTSSCCHRRSAARTRVASVWPGRPGGGGRVRGSFSDSATRSRPSPTAPESAPGSEHTCQAEISVGPPGPCSSPEP